MSEQTKQFKGFVKFGYYWGIFFSCSAILQMAKQGFSLDTFIIGILFGFFPFFIGLGAKSKDNNWVPPPAPPKVLEGQIEPVDTIESKLIRLSAEGDFALNPSEVVIKLKISHQQATEALEEMVVKGVFATDNTSQGTVVYYNRDFTEQYEHYNKNS